jgi:hypothetical protein
MYYKNGRWIHSPISADLECDECKIGQPAQWSPERKSKCLAFGCITECSGCGSIIEQRCLLGHGYVCASYDDYTLFKEYFSALTQGMLQPFYVYMMPAYVDIFYRKRQKKYARAMANSVIAELVAIIVEYV